MRAAVLAGLLAAVAAALPLPGLLPHGPDRGDARLPPGDDESSAGIPLRPSPRLLGGSARRLFVGTNGVISTQDFPRETQYVDDDFPTDFPVIAPFLADLDTSEGRGNIYYRQDDSPAVLSQAAGYIQAGFPHTAGSFVPTNVFIATWERVGAYQPLSRDAEPSEKLNTFQAVIAYNHEDTYTIFLYPEGGLQFLGTRPKESYNVQLELPARVGFSWGDGDDPKWDGLFHSLASSEQALRHLERESNAGVPGVWVFHVGSVSPLEHVEPGIGGWGVPQSPAHRQPGIANYARTLYSHAGQTSTELLAQHGLEATLPHPDLESHAPALLDVVPEGLPVSPGQDRSRRLHPDGYIKQQSYSPNPSSYSSGHHGVGVDEDVHFNPDVFTYNTASKETCAQHHGRCSPHAFCTDYATGVCCHCQATYYGNGRQCLPEGAVHRLNGKVSGSLTVGQALVRFQDVDLHTYVVGSDGRAYTAISGVPQPAARALLPLVPIGGLFAWLFALEEPGSENGFSITGAEFTQNLEVTFYPGEEKVHITQTAEGLGPDNYLNLKTHIQGQVPFVPEDVTVHITPYKELYHYSSSAAVTSSTQREYILAAGTANQTLSYRLRQNVTFSGCPYAHLPARQRLSVARAFALYDSQEHVLRYALASRIAPAPDGAETPQVSPCHDGTHACEAPARCQPGAGMEYTCECAAGYHGDGRGCRDVDECAENPCHPAAVCYNVPGSFSCRCQPGYEGDGFQCVHGSSQRLSPCQHEQLYPRAVLPGPSPVGDGHVPQCDEEGRYRPLQCHSSSGHCWCVDAAGQEIAGTRTLPGHTPPRCGSPESVQQLTPCEHERLYPRVVPPGPSLVGDGHVPQCDEEGRYRPLQCHSSSGHCWCVDAAGQEIAGTRTLPGRTPPRCGSPEPTERPHTMCERWRQSLLEHYGGSPRHDQYVPQCDAEGNFTPLQCHGDSGYCWCVDESGREIQGTRSEPGSTPPCLPSVAPPSVRPSPRPDVSPPATGTFLLYAQGQQIGYLPLNGTRLQKEAAKTLLSLHGSIVVGIDYDCREKMIYWTDVAGRTINRASLEAGAEPETVISSGLLSPEGLAVDHLRRAVFWTDSGLDKIERARLDGSERRVLFDTELVNPRAIAVDPVRGNLYWTDWNREAPKIETSTVNGANRRVLVNKDIGLPNGLTFDPFSKLLCWADAGTKHLECTFPDGTGRRVIQNNLNYPFSIISYADHFYHTDWRRDGVIAVNKETGSFTDEYLPEQRSHLYGITAVYPYCPGARK
ncbi:nidogen-2 isoform X3 [Phaenicophaeus curvirostris]|uniref:nidogen-2 isoform X3 n=1 Tax=Phaenicophaeus curvirostris TaxID=33595 RepID=UPI0037F0DAAD